MRGLFDWQRAVLADKSLQSGTKLVILVIGVRLNKRTHEAFPSYKTIADEASMSRRSVVSHVELAVEAGWLRKEVRKKSEKENDSNVYRLAYPNSDVEVDSPSEIVAPEVVQPLHQVVQTVHHPSADVAPPLVQPLHPNREVLTEKLTVKEKRTRTKAANEGKTLDEYRAECDAAGLTIINEDDPIYETAKRLGMPEYFIAIAWASFTEKYGGSDKRQKDWKAAFRTEVRKGWVNVWAQNRNGEYYLNNYGKTLENELGYGN